MSYNNGIIQSPVTVDDLKLCFGLATGNLATIIQNADINKWAMCKPNRLTDNLPFVEYDSNGIPMWAQGIQQENKAYGVDWSNAIVTSVAALIAMYGAMNNNVWTSNGNNNSAWTYDRPTVANGCAMRMGDFRGYVKNAEAIVGDFKLSEAVTRSGKLCLYNQDIPNATSTELDIHFKIKVLPKVATRRLYLGDLMLDALTAMTELRWGIAREYYNVSGELTQELMYLSSGTIASTLDSNGYANLTININQSGTEYVNRWVFTQDGTMYVCMPCLVNSDATKMVALPNVTPLTVYTILGSSVWECSVYTEDADMEVPYRITLHNYSSSDETATVKCILSSDGEIEWTAEENDYSVTVPAGEDYVIPSSDTWDNLAADQNIDRSHLFLSVEVNGATLFNKQVTQIDVFS